MASVGITFPAQVAGFLNAYVPGFAEASGGSSTVMLQVPAFSAPPSQVAAGLGEAGVRIPAAMASGAPFAIPENSATGLARYAPEGLVPQGEALQTLPPAAVLPSPVAAGLNDAGVGLPSGAASGAPLAIPADAAFGLAQFAPGGLAPQGEALENPGLVEANLFVQNLAEAGGDAASYFAGLGGAPPPANLDEISARIAEVSDVLGGFGIAFV